MKTKTIGEGGSHCHKIMKSSVTENDGEHKHIFMINERLIMTNLSGSHSHSIDASKNEIGPANSHEHTINIKTQDGVLEFQTEDASPHIHEIQSYSTTLSGIHTHEVDINGKTYVSITPADLIEEIENEKAQIAHLKNYKVRKSEDYPFELDFQGVKRLNKRDFHDILKKVSFKVFLKSISRIADGFQVERLILSRDRFEDIGSARRFVMDHNLNVMSSRDAESEGVFIFEVHSQDRFVESTLHRVQITDGVIAVIGLLRENELGQQLEQNGNEGKAEDSLTENATRSTREQETAEGTIDEFTDNMKALIPTDSMDNDQLEASRKQRSSKYGIEILDEGSALTFPKGFPNKLDDYGDPVNLKYPIETVARARNARVRFKQFADRYKQTKSKRVVHERIVRRELKFGIKPSFDPDDSLDQLLPSSIKDRLKSVSMEELKFKFDSVSSLYEKACGNKHHKKIKKPECKKGEKIEFEIFKQEQEKRLVTGPILIPDQFDLQKDIISSEEIEKAIHNYMVKLAFQDRDEEFLVELGLNNKSERGFMHTEFNRKIAFVEIFIVNDDRGFMLINGKKVKNGTAVGTAKIFDDEVWALVKTGKITGFSIGGRSKVIPLEKMTLNEKIEHLKKKMAIAS